MKIWEINTDERNAELIHWANTVDAIETTYRKMGNTEAADAMAILRVTMEYTIDRRAES